MSQVSQLEPSQINLEDINSKLGMEPTDLCTRPNGN